jgi:hypothetical protein
MCTQKTSERILFGERRCSLGAWSYDSGRAKRALVRIYYLTTIMSSNLQQSYYSVPLGSLNPYSSVTVHIESLFNNQAASKSGYLADFDGHGSSYDATYLPMGRWVYDGITVSIHHVHPSSSALTFSWVQFSVFVGNPGGQHPCRQPSDPITGPDKNTWNAFLVR